MNLRELQTLVGTIENFYQNQKHTCFARSVYKIDPTLTSDNEELLRASKIMAEESDSSMSLVVSNRVYEACKNGRDITNLIESASEEYNVKPYELHDERLVTFIQNHPRS